MQVLVQCLVHMHIQIHAMLGEDTQHDGHAAEQILTTREPWKALKGARLVLAFPRSCKLLGMRRTRDHLQWLKIPGIRL